MITSYNTENVDTEKIKRQSGERIERIISLQKFTSLFYKRFTSGILKTYKTTVTTLLPQKDDLYISQHIYIYICKNVVLYKSFEHH